MVKIGTNFRPFRNGPYKVDSQFDSDKSTISIPYTGIYYIAASVTIYSTGNQRFEVAVIDQSESGDMSLTTIEENQPGPYHTLTLTSFMKLHVGQKFNLKIRTDVNKPYTVRKTTTITFHYSGAIGSVPAYLAQVSENITLDNNGIIKPWVTDGKQKLFRSLYGKYI